MVLQMARFHSFLWLSGILCYDSYVPHLYPLVCWVFRLLLYLVCRKEAAVNRKEESESVSHSFVQSCLTLCDPMDCGPPGSSVLGILQARILEWVDVSFSRRSFQPRDQTWVSCIAGGFFTTELSGKPGFYVGRTLIGFRDAQKGNPSHFLCSSPLCFALVRAQAGHKQLRRRQRSLNWTTWWQWRRACPTVGQMVTQWLPEYLLGLGWWWWVCGRQVGAGLEILLGLLWDPVPHVLVSSCRKGRRPNPQCYGTKCDSGRDHARAGP